MIARRRERAFKGLPMEGIVARWYAGLRRSEGQIEERRKPASRLTGLLPDGDRVLEVAPGPGYLAIEVARSGRFHVTGLDISRSFDLVVCQAAFKNFAQPQRAIEEMHRVLRDGDGGDPGPAPRRLRRRHRRGGAGDGAGSGERVHD
ncbi:MAG TPA: methyltransferase domain-containing protein [Candidatus Dormibacteraeota bacterium]|nr:methyltransferase domain-containing protein [Candidatus Dormibacteraeota bacterium]